MDGGLIAQAIGALGGGFQQGRDRVRREAFQDQQMAQQAERIEAERLYRESMLTNAERQLQRQIEALEDARRTREEAATTQAQQYQEAVQALIARRVPEAEARVMARDPQLLRSAFEPTAPKAPRTQYDATRGGLINLDEGTFQPIQGLPAAPQGGGAGGREIFNATLGGFIDPTTKTFTPVQGLPPRGGQGERPLTEGQRKASAFLTQATDANRVIEEVVGVQTDPKSGEVTSGGRQAPTLWEGFTSRFPGAGTSNYLRSDEYRRMEAAALRLSDAWLRYTSGAAVPEPEVRRFASSFLPAPGDDQKTLVDKARARRLIIQSLEQGVGRPGDVDTETEARLSGMGLFGQFNLEPPPGGR